MRCFGQLYSVFAPLSSVVGVRRTGETGGDTTCCTQRQLYCRLTACSVVGAGRSINSIVTHSVCELLG